MTTLDAATTETHAQRARRLAAEVEALRRQLRHSQRLATVGTMAAMVAHEFNNILTPVINYALLARTNPALADKALKLAEQGGRRAAEICRSILGMASPDASEPESVVICEAVTEALTAMARRPERDGITLSVNVPADLTVSIRRIELLQVLINLLINARTALLERSAPRLLTVTAEADGAMVDIRVRDNGPGIDRDNIDRIFTPFFTTRGDSGGHGLGLTICHEIASAAGGGIGLDTSPDTGTIFTLRLRR